jgi:hypothetical protein
LYSLFRLIYKFEPESRAEGFEFLNNFRHCRSPTERSPLWKID